MGGHGGLNILPQKKWNVYNYDNRAIVEKDKKLHAAKKKKEFEKKREKALEMKMQVLGQSKTGEKIQKNQQEHFIPEMHDKHFNLFEKEEALVQNGALKQYKKKISENYIRSQGIEEDGVQLKSTPIPWYAKRKYAQQEKVLNKQEKWESVEAKKTNSVAIQEYYASEAQRIKQKQYYKEEKEDEERGERERSREKPKKKSEMDILREKRLKREKKERQKALKLLSK